MRFWLKMSVCAASIAIAVMASCEPPMPCDSSDTCDQCVICAEDGPCKELFLACIQIADCFPFGTCAEDCSGDMTCQQKCAQKYPEGVQPAQKLNACLICEQCPKRCAMLTGDCGK